MGSGTERNDRQAKRSSWFTRGSILERRPAGTTGPARRSQACEPTGNCRLRLGSRVASCEPVTNHRLDRGGGTGVRGVSVSHPRHAPSIGPRSPPYVVCADSARVLTSASCSYSLASSISLARDRSSATSRASRRIWRARAQSCSGPFVRRLARPVVLARHPCLRGSRQQHVYPRRGLKIVAAQRIAPNQRAHRMRCIRLRSPPTGFSSSPPPDPRRLFPNRLEDRQKS
jgi:hypothetical protein